MLCPNSASSNLISYLIAVEIENVNFKERKDRIGTSQNYNFDVKLLPP